MSYAAKSSYNYITVVLKLLERSRKTWDIFIYPSDLWKKTLKGKMNKSHKLHFTRMVKKMLVKGQCNGIL